MSAYWLYVVTLFVSISLALDIANVKIFGHRGGIRHLVPDSSLLSFSIGAQSGVDYLECDIVSSKDGELIVMHDYIIDNITNIEQHSEFFDRKTTFNHSTREINMASEIYYENISSTGYFAFNFTFSELKTLKLRARYPYFENGPLNDKFDILSFKEFLYLINNLSLSLNRSIGITPELKGAWIMRDIGLSMEEKYMSSLYETGFIELIDNKYYKTKYFKKNNNEYSNNNISLPMLIVQSDSYSALKIIGNLSNNNYNLSNYHENVPLQFGIYSRDTINLHLFEWMTTFVGGVNMAWNQIDEYYELITNNNINNISMDMNQRIHFRVQDFINGDGRYSNQYVTNQYFKAFYYKIKYNLDAIFTDNAENINTIIDMIYEYTNSSSLLYQYGIIINPSSNNHQNNGNWDINAWFVLFIVMLCIWIGTVIYWIVLRKRSINSTEFNSGTQFAQIAVQDAATNND